MVGGEIMALVYKKLWKKLIDLNLRKYQLREMAQISSNTMTKLGKNESVNTDVISKICACLHCDVGDICEYEAENNGEIK